MARIYEVYPPIQLGDSAYAPKMVVGIDDGINADGTQYDSIPVSIDVRNIDNETEVFRYIQLDQLDDLITVMLYARHRINEFRKENGYEAPPEAQG